MENLGKKELIGLEVEITNSKNKSNIGIKGKIINETKNTIMIDCNGERKTLLKSNITIKGKMEEKTFIINGERLCSRPEDRIKKG